MVWILVIALLVTAGPSANANLNSYDYYDESTTSACRILPVSRPPITFAAGEENITLLNLLGKGTSELFPESESIPRDVVLILGNTGSGKTTLTQMIAGDLTKLHAVQTAGGRLVIIDDGEKIGAPETTSRTIIPDLVITESESFFDCPGFDDNRGPVFDVAVSYFMNQITERVSRIKLIFLINQNSVTIGEDRNEFGRLASHAVRFVKAIGEFHSSIGLVVTKVDNPLWYRYPTDYRIIRNIVRFLNVYKTDIQKMLLSETGMNQRDLYQRQIEFVNILFSKENGTYNHITISTSPDSCGRLSEIDSVKDTRSRVSTLIRYLNFTGIGNSSANFGFTLKAESLLKVKEDYINEVNEAVSVEISEQLKNLLEWYRMIYANCTKDFPSVGYELLNIWENVDSLEIEEDTFLPNISAELCLRFSAMGFNCTQQFKKSMAEKNAYLEFFDKVTESKVGRHNIRWMNSINEVREKITTDRDDFKLDILQNRVNKVNEMIIWQVQNETNSILEQIDEMLHKEEDTLPMMNNLTWYMLSQSDKFASDFPNSPTEFAEHFAHLANSLGSIRVSEDFIQKLTEAEEAFNFFESFLQRPVNKQVNDWTKPLFAIQKKLNMEMVNIIRSEYAPEVINKIQLCFNKIEQNFITWFSGEKAKEVANYPRVSEQMQTRWNISMPSINNSIENPMEIYQIYNNLSKQMGYDLSSDNDQCVTNQSNLLQYFETVSGEKLTRSVSNWSIPIQNMQQLVLDYRQEYYNLLENKFVPEASDGITSIMNKSLESFISWLEDSKPENIENTDTFINNIDDIKLHLLNVSSNLGMTFDFDLSAVFGRFGFTPSSEYQMIKSHLGDLQFFDSLEGASVQRRYDMWRDLLVNTIQKLDNIRSLSTRPLEQRVYQKNEEIRTQIANIMNNVNDALDRKLIGINPSLVQETLLQFASDLLQQYKVSKDSVTVCRDVSNAFNEYLEVSISSDFVSECSSNELDIQKLERITGIEHARNSALWLEPLIESVQRIVVLQSWYKFCDNVTETHGKYNFQVTRPTPEDFQPRLWIQFLEQRAHIQVPLNLLQINQGSIHFGHLTKIIESALTPVNISCKNNSNVAKGNYVRLSDVLRGLDHRYTRCNDLRRLEIYAKNVIFIDSDFSSPGENELSVVLVAPVIEVVGEQTISLNGRVGESHGKAKDGKYTYAKEFEEAGVAVGLPVTAAPDGNGERTWINIETKTQEQKNEVSGTNPNSRFHKFLHSLRSGSHGLGGRVGGSGGTFMAITSKILKASDLTVTSNGGRGGRGQDGGDGAKGNSCSVKPGNVCYWTAYIGGNGGNGGVGGPGGDPGRIDILAENACMVIKERKQGQQGPPGIGGAPGLGGRGASGKTCQGKYFAFWSWEDTTDCRTEHGSNSKDGEKGRDGTSVKTVAEPRPQEKSVGLSYAKQQYANIYGWIAADNIFSQWD